MRKRSVFLNGRKTSISLETQFWECIKRIAARDALSVSGLIARIDRERNGSNLSSAVRLFVLRDVRSQIEPPSQAGVPAEHMSGAAPR